MPAEDASQPKPDPKPEEYSSSSDSENDPDSDSDSENETETPKTSPAQPDSDSDSDPPSDDDTPEANIKRFTKVLNSHSVRRKQFLEERDIEYHEDKFDFPKDPENWTEMDLPELWADAPLDMTKPGWDPSFVDDDEIEVLKKEAEEGRELPIAPFYVPYRKPYPAIPDDHFDIGNAKAAIEELDRIEEFLQWASYIFPDGSSYEGTVWDDLAHGKGVYVALEGLVRYEGEWLQNNMEGHGVVEVDIPDYEPVPGSKLEAKMRAEGKIIKRDFMSPEDREWLEMDIEDSIRLSGGQTEIPFYENEEWIRQFGEKPEKGRYRYAGQWKHARMHGCGVYEVNERTVYGRFYFGQLLDDDHGCDVNTSALHAGIAEVAAAKARMFVNKPDGMVREERGPFSDPQHPYFYEEEDAWMAPGFINQFYEVPDYWKPYVGAVDEEREMWLNSFYKAPLRIPMPAELEYWWAKDETPEFVLINKEPEPDPEDPSKLVYTDDPVILHTPTGRIINYVDDEKHGVRLFWQPPPEEVENLDPNKVEFLPLGFDEFYGRVPPVQKPNIGMRFLMAVENACKPMFDKLEKWAEERKKDSEMKMKLIEREQELAEAELCLKEEMEEMDEVLKILEKEEEKKAKYGLQEGKDTSASEPTNQYEKTSPTGDEDDDEIEDEDEGGEEDQTTPSDFGSIIEGQGQTKDEQNGKRAGGSPFAALSLPFAASGLASLVPSQLQQSFVAWKQSKYQVKTSPRSLSLASPLGAPEQPRRLSAVRFPLTVGHGLTLRAARQSQHEHKFITKQRPRCHLKHKVGAKLQRDVGERRPGDWNWVYTDPIEELNILSLHTQV